MGITIDQGRAFDVLEDAVEWAQSPRAVPPDWVNRTRRIDECPNTTFTAALGTALLAKATDPRIDALALKATTGPNAYSARSVAHGVLVPAAPDFGFDLRATGREPLNNQPFFRYDRIDQIDRVRPAARPFLPDLVKACERINELSAREATAALAAFIRVRLEAAAAAKSVDLRGAPLGVTDLLAGLTDFISENPEGGRRGQALAAAAFDLAFAHVRTGRINDPSRKYPGDVQVLDGAVVLLAAEVRQKIVYESDVLQFASALRDAGAANGVMVALHPSQEPLPRDDLVREAESEHGVLVSIIEGTDELMLGALLWSGRPLEDSLRLFPERMLRRMVEIEVSHEGQERWASLFADALQDE